MSISPPNQIKGPVLNARNILFGFLAFFLYLLIFIYLYQEVIFGGKTFFRRDIMRFYHPLWHFAVEALKRGIIPLWDPYHYCGIPFLANIQTCVFYPLTVLLYLPDFTWAFNFYILWHLAMASFFTFLWMKDCGLSKEASLISGLAFGMSGYMMSTINLTISLCSAAYFPLALLTFRRSLIRPGFFWRGLTALVLWCQCLAGDPSILFVTIFVMMLFSLYKTVEERIERKKFPLKFFSNLVQIVFVFLGLSAFQTLLFSEFLLHSQRLYLDFSEKMLWSVQYNDLLGIVIPFFTDISMSVMNYWVRQSWLENYYSGITVFCFALTAVYFSRGRNLVGYHVLLVLLGLMLSLGQFSLVYPFIHQWTPFLNFVRYPVRFFFLFSFGIACLSGLGIDLALKTLERKLPSAQARPVLGPILLFLTVTGAAIFSVVFFDSIHTKAIDFVQKNLAESIKSAWELETTKEMVSAALVNAKRTLLFLAMTLAGLMAATYLKPRRGVAVFFFAFLVFADLTTSNAFEPSLPSEILNTPTRNIRVLMEDKTLFRFMPSPKTVYMQIWGTGRPHGGLQEDQKDLLISNTIMQYGLFDVVGYNSIYLKDFNEIEKFLMMARWPSQAKLMNALNIKYVVSPQPNLNSQFELAHSSKSANVFRNKEVLPRAFLVERAAVEKDKPAMLKKFIDGGFKPERQLFIEEEPEVINLPSSSEDNISSNPVIFLRYSPNEVKMRAKGVSNRQWLFFSDAYYPGWKAWVDKKPVKIYKANYAFRAIPLSPGAHEIIWKYDPPLFKLGLVITLITGFGLLGYYARFPKRLRF